MRQSTFRALLERALKEGDAPVLRVDLDQDLEDLTSTGQSVHRSTRTQTGDQPRPRGAGRRGSEAQKEQGKEGNSFLLIFL